MFALGGRLGTLLNSPVLAYSTAGYTNAHFDWSHYGQSI